MDTNQVEFVPKMPDLIKAPLSEIKEWVGKLPLDEGEKTVLLEAISRERKSTNKERSEF